MFFKSNVGKDKVLKLYNQKLKELCVDYSELSIETSFGSTNIITTGNTNKSINKKQ